MAAGEKKRSVVSRIVTVSQIVAGLALLTAAVINIPSAGLGPFVLIVLLFTALFFVFAFGSWRGKRWGYIGGIIPSVIVNLLFGSPTDILYNPGNTEFPLAFTFYVASFLAIVYGAYGFYTAKRTAVPRQISRNSTLALVMAGVAIGGLLVGTFAGATQTRLLSVQGQQGDIKIVQGAGSLTTGAYSPGNFTVKAGSTVTWSNGDSNVHTVTSTTGAFDSGNMNSGDTYKHTFTQPGTYQYICTIHPNMKGTIVVTP
ncbi:MAG: cupredoxin family copper-binding protein [Thaumarchaeota archaeon]|nr:cupredoxin family copper-binding protein [Nitrososphaerota archaeon]